MKRKKPTYKITLPPMLDWQYDVLEDDHRYQICICGRRSGKTRLGAIMMLKSLLREETSCWLSPTYAVSQICENILIDLITQINKAAGEEIITQVKGDKKFKYKNGEIYIKSAVNPDNLRGNSYNFCVFDEAAYIQETVWTDIIRPSLSDYQGKVVFISTPRGRNYLYHLFLKGQIDNNNYKSWKLSTYCNPYILPAEIEEAKMDMPIYKFKQEYLADFDISSSDVFKNIYECVDESIKPIYNKSHTYYIGVDIAKSVDYTSITVLDVDTKSIVDIIRYQNIPYTDQVDHIIDISNKYNAKKVIIEQNNAGSAIIDMMKQKKCKNIEAFITTNKTKVEIIEKLAIAFEQKTIKIPNINYFLDELTTFSSSVTPNGAITYRADKGNHDDTIMSSAIAWSGFNKKSNNITTFDRKKIKLFG